MATVLKKSRSGKTTKPKAAAKPAPKQPVLAVGVTVRDLGYGGQPVPRLPGGQCREGVVEGITAREVAVRWGVTRSFIRKERCHFGTAAHNLPGTAAESPSFDRGYLVLG